MTARPVEWYRWSARGPLQNLIDLKYLHGIDLAIVQLDALEYARQQNFIENLDSLTYVAKLYNEEFHLLVDKI